MPVLQERGKGAARRGEGNRACVSVSVTVAGLRRDGKGDACRAAPPPSGKRPSWEASRQASTARHQVGSRAGNDPWHVAGGSAAQNSTLAPHLHPRVSPRWPPIRLPRPSGRSAAGAPAASPLAPRPCKRRFTSPWPPRAPPLLSRPWTSRPKLHEGARALQRAPRSCRQRGEHDTACLHPMRLPCASRLPGGDRQQRAAPRAPPGAARRCAAAPAGLAGLSEALGCYL